MSDPAHKEGTVADAAMLSSILDSLTEPVLVADTEHRVVYMNDAAVRHYSGGESLLGTSLLDCHGERSRRMMRDVLEALRAGEEEHCITDNERHRIFMRAVRDRDGRLIGYFERYAPPGVSPGGPKGERE